MKTSIFTIIIYCLIFLIVLCIGYDIIKWNRKQRMMIEPMTCTKNDAEFDKLKKKFDSSKVGNIKSLQPKYGRLPIKDYCIKSSFNSATTGKHVHENMIKYVLMAGCRFIDFEIFSVRKNNNFMPVIAESNDPEFKVFSTNNSIGLDKAFTTIITNAFSDTSPNKKDPLFIHLRIKSKDSGCYSAVAKLIENILKPRLYDSQVDRDTKMSELLGKIIIVVDKTIHRDYKNYAKCNNSETKCYDLSNYTNVESGSQTINLMSLTDIENVSTSPVLIKDDNISTTSNRCKLVLPFENITNNPIMGKMILNQGAQMVGYRYNLQDKNLEDCEIFFNDNRGGIVPLAAAIPYFEREKKESRK